MSSLKLVGGVILGLVVAICSPAMGAGQIVYEQYVSWSTDLSFIEGSETASDVVPDPLSWENRKEVGDLISLTSANPNITKVDVLLGQWLDRSFAGDMVLKFYNNNGGAPGSQFFETTAPIISSNTSGGALPIDFSFSGFSQAVPNEFFYSVGIRNVTYSGGTGGYYLSQTGHPSLATIGSTDAGIWELTENDVWQFGTTAANANVRIWADTSEPVGFGKDWVRSHPMTFTGRMDWTSNQTEFDLIANSQLNTVHSGFPDTLDFASQNNFPWHGWRQAESLATVTQYYNDYAGNIGWLNRDEPNRAELPAVGQNAAELKALAPNSIIYTSAHSKGSVETSNYSYTDYLNDMIDVAGSQVILSNTYPFMDDGTTDTDRWFDHVTALRNVGHARDVPYWMWVQSSSFAGHRLPSESDMRMSVFSALSSGFTGILFYRYHAPLNETGILENDRITPSPLYAPVTDAVPEAVNIGESLKFLTSTDLRFIPGGVSSTPTGLVDWDVNAGQGLILSVNVDATPAADKDGLIGYFTDDDGGDYFMLVNLLHGAGLSSAVTSVDFTVTFDNTIDRIWRLNRETGLPEEIQLLNHVLSLTLPGGTGDLFKFYDGNFAGVLLGDLNSDGFVGIIDLNIVLGNWNQNVPPGDPLADPSGDGFVGIEDLNTVLGNWNAGTPPTGGAAIPEPTTFWLLGMAGIVIIRHRNTS